MFKFKVTVNRLRVCELFTVNRVYGYHLIVALKLTLAQQFTIHDKLFTINHSLETNLASPRGTHGAASEAVGGFDFGTVADKFFFDRIKLQCE